MPSPCYSEEVLEAYGHSKQATIKWTTAWMASGSEIMAGLFE